MRGLASRGAMRAALALLVALSALPLAVAFEPQAVRYVGGFSQLDPAGHELSGPCGTHTTPDGETVAVGGVCGVAVATGETVTVDVVDDVLGPDVAFSVWLVKVEHVGDGVVVVSRCAPRVDAVGSVTVTVPEGCSELHVRLDVGATTGTLALS